VTHHIYETCPGRTCSRCRDGQDCFYETFAVCKICGGFEGSLLPECPGKQLTYDEHQENYKHYCADTGPFAKEQA
jgi:hypothetical protein